MCKSCASHPEAKSLWPVTHSVSPDSHCSNAWQVSCSLSTYWATPADRPHASLCDAHWKHSNTFNTLSFCASQITQNSMWRLGVYLPQKCGNEPNSLPKGHTTRMTRVSVRHIACSWIPCLRKAKFADSSYVISQFHSAPPFMQNCAPSSNFGQQFLVSIFAVRPNLWYAKINNPPSWTLLPRIFTWCTCSSSVSDLIKVEKKAIREPSSHRTLCNFVLAISNHGARGASKASATLLLSAIVLDLDETALFATKNI